MQRDDEALGTSRRRFGALAVLTLTLFASALSVPLASADVGPLTLPDHRAWEQVSPVDKNGNDIFRGGAMAALDGNRLLFKSPGAFAGAASSLAAGGGVSYIANRGGVRWDTTPIMPPSGTFGSNGYAAFTADLSKGLLWWYDQEAAFDPEARAPGFNLYLHDTASGQFQVLNTFDTLFAIDTGFEWGSKDLSTVAIESTDALTPDSPCVDKHGGETYFTDACAYEWDNGVLRLASVLPNGEPVEGTPGNGTPGNDIPGGGSVDHAVSDDGSRLFFTSPPDANLSERQLYVREDGTTTRLVSVSERTLPGGVTEEPVSFQDAEAAHGDWVTFTTDNTLVDTDQDETNDLYMYDFTKPEGERLTLISADENPEAPSGAQVDSGFSQGGIAGASEDLRRIYFVADNQIVDGAPEAPGPKLYLWDDTGSFPKLTYVATLLGGDYGTWRTRYKTVANFEQRDARVSADGRFLTFLSGAKLTDFENEGRKEVYLYDAAAGGSLQCASCSADAFPAEGAIEFNTVPSGGFSVIPSNHVLENLSESGQVFFQTTRGLVPRDSNGKLDIYEYENGELRLISTGTGDSSSYFLDATPSGSDVFFTTRDRLVGWDKDENFDAYDARINGGLPEPPPPPPPCEGDSCQPPPVVPSDPSLGSASFNGPGDAKPRKSRRCRAGKVRRHGRCRAKPKAARTRSHHHVTRSHG